MIMGMCIGCSPYNAEQSVITQAIAVLRKFGPDAHVYLPGVVMLNGLQAGNYIHSNGTGPGEVDQPVGLVLDAAGGLGVELVMNPGPFLSLSGWAVGNASASISLAGENIRVTRQTAGANWPNVRTVLTGLTIGRSYQIKSKLVNPFGIQVYHSVLGTALAESRSFASGDIFSVFVATATSHSLDVGIWGSAGTVGQYMEFSASSFREVTGIHATQPTTSAKPILRRGAVNLLTYSGDFSNAAWNVSGSFTKNTATTAICGADSVSRLYAGASGFTVGAAVTGGFVLSGTPGAVISVEIQDEIAGYPWSSTGLITLSSVPTLYVVTRPSVTSTNITIRVSSKGSAATIVSGGAALFQGTYTAQQIQALGGIPTTLTAPVSTALGAYWWDTSGSKSLVATFPAGNESVTVINATPTGQVTTTAQNVVGAYSINTNTNGRIIVNGVLTASELALLQSYANRLAGL